MKIGNIEEESNNEKKIKFKFYVLSYSYFPIYYIMEN